MSKYSACSNAWSIFVAHCIVFSTAFPSKRREHSQHQPAELMSM
jgi:hypothetical protein